MRTRVFNIVSVGLLLMSLVVNATARDVSGQTEPQRVTLYARVNYKAEGYGRSAFNFQHGVRSDDENWLKRAGNYDQMLYGNISIDGNADWFSVSSGGESWDRIKDLGEVEWADLCCAPLLLAHPRPSGGIRTPGRGESFEASSDGRVTEAVVGHMYVVHIKTKQVDHYVMFRVEELAANDHCTITWKVMPSPE